MKVIVDRFEGDYAVCEREDQVMINIEKTKLPEGVKEGDILFLEDKRVIVDGKETMSRRKRIDEMMRNLWDK